ncbi:hypothetical protein NA56DRAFT_648850 [Hyaloscypha hepaticicola]|uniref:Uncharacterized protein n=1 Tax=Hyaloscypha hepaticicola TaxID=2082293 RepID=A0A2J6PT46_9HELO|nr:hypothetical protein NA56DRAFT_648850 [Hyaloscypha hepaticicola]
MAAQIICMGILYKLFDSGFPLRNYNSRRYCNACKPHFTSFHVLIIPPRKIRTSFRPTTLTPPAKWNTPLCYWI